MIGLMRLTLAVSALLIIYIDPAEPDRFVTLTYASLIVYVVYSAVIYFISVYGRRQLPNTIAPWIDVACYLVLVSLSSGTSSVFFFFFFFPVLVASFRSGFGPGISTAIVSSVLFTVIGYATAPAGSAFELNRFLLRPVYLLVLGYMMAYWGGREIRLKQRLSLLREIIYLSNPRFGVSYTIGSMLAKIQSFYDADTCLLVLIDPLYKDTRLFRLSRTQAVEKVRAEQIPEKLEQLLLSLPDHIAIIHQEQSRIPLWRGDSDYAFDLTNQKRATGGWQEVCNSLASKLELGAFVSVPLHYRGKTIGRLYVTAGQRTFSASDVDFLMQVVEQIMPVIHNIRLLAQLALNAAEEERQRLARDVHDSVVQPYIGLQYKLTAIRNKSAEGKDTTEDIERLFQMTVDEVNSLRGFVRGLKEGSEPRPSFMSAVRRFAEHFSESYDLDVQIESKGEIEVNDRLAAQLIRIVQEGLSNVRKHTDASFCKITLEPAGPILRLSIVNNKPRQNGSGRDDFVPRSITERTEDLGGKVRIEQTLDGDTAVRVEIPL
jgi:signal transduction histidine kinase